MASEGDRRPDEVRTPFISTTLSPSSTMVVACEKRETRSGRAVSKRPASEEGVEDGLDDAGVEDEEVVVVMMWYSSVCC